jgi:hypothetical protein
MAGQGEGPSAAETAATRRSNKSKVENNRCRALLLKEKCFPLFSAPFIHLRLVRLLPAPLKANAFKRREVGSKGISLFNSRSKGHSGCPLL